MASKIHSSILAAVVIISVLLGTTVAGRDILRENNNVNQKEPEWFHNHDRSFLIPGIGRVLVPPMHHSHSRLPSIPIRGGNGFGGISGPPPIRQMPGADDTYVPKPGFEVPGPVVGIVPVPPTARP